MPMTQISRLEVKGFKSICQLNDFKLESLNVLIGANGAGKSNLVSFFRLLGWMVQESLQQHIGELGFANSILFDGAKTTPQIEATISFQTDQGLNEYRMRLMHAAGDTLIFADEEYRFIPSDLAEEASWSSLGAGHRETGLTQRAAEDNTTARFILNLLKGCVVYQFHDTSKKARIRQNWNVEDNYFLKEDGGNLGPFLHRLKVNEGEHYLRIVRTIRQILPFFGDFYLEQDGPSIPLRWKENGTDMVFGAAQASDGMLRAMALVALLLQPVGHLPPVIILDEPELGLHPYAISVIAGLLKSVSIHRQVILATQSTAFIDCFGPEDIIIVERKDRESIFTRPNWDTLTDWINTYSIAELWEKNVLGGRPG
jgi:predicted ATPase